MNGKKMKKAGFTLIELVVTIAVLGIVGSLSAVGYSGYQAATQEYTAKKALGTIQDAYLYARTTTKDDASAIGQAATLISEEMYGHYTIESNSTSYTITYENNGNIYSLTDGIITEEGPDYENESTVSKLTGRVYEDMVTIVTDLKNLSSKEKHAYFEAHGYTHPNNSLGNDAYRSYLFNTFYEKSWPEVPKDFCEKYGLPEKLYIQPYVQNINNPEDVIVFANSNNSTSGNWYTNLVSIDGVWYYGGKNYISVSSGYSSVKNKVTSNWTALQ